MSAVEGISNAGTGADFAKVVPSVLGVVIVSMRSESAVIAFVMSSKGPRASYAAASALATSD